MVSRSETNSTGGGASAIMGSAGRVVTASGAAGPRPVQSPLQLLVLPAKRPSLCVQHAGPCGARVRAVRRFPQLDRAAQPRRARWGRVERHSRSATGCPHTETALRAFTLWCATAASRQGCARGAHGQRPGAGQVTVLGLQGNSRNSIVRVCSVHSGGRPALRPRRRR